MPVMKAKIASFATLAAILALVPFAQSASAESIPDWIKNNAGWWASGQIEDDSFVQGIQFLIKEGILVVPPTSISAEKSEGVPDWVKNNAGWWADGITTDNEFVSAIQHLMKSGIISIDSAEAVVESAPVKSVSGNDSELQALQAELDVCGEISKAYERLNCEKAAKDKITEYEYRTTTQAYVVGDVTFYYPGVHFETMASGQDILTVKMLVHNTGSSKNTSMMCSGPSVCNYDVWNGEKAFKYSTTDFTSGTIVLKPGQSREFTMVFGPNIGYGGTKFVYDPSKQYEFRISEPWGSLKIPLDIG
jgi:hypothetical protein